LFTYTTLFRAPGLVLPVSSEVRASTQNGLVRQFAETAATCVTRHHGYLESTGLVDYSALPHHGPGLLGGGTQMSDLLVPFLVFVAALLAAIALFWGLRTRPTAAGRRERVTVPQPPISQPAARMPELSAVAAIPAPRDDATGRFSPLSDIPVATVTDSGAYRLSPDTGPQAAVRSRRGTATLTDTGSHAAVSDTGPIDAVADTGSHRAVTDSGSHRVSSSGSHRMPRSRTARHSMPPSPTQAGPTPCRTAAPSAHAPIPAPSEFPRPVPTGCRAPAGRGTPCGASSPLTAPLHQLPPAGVTVPDPERRTRVPDKHCTAPLDHPPQGRALRRRRTGDPPAHRVRGRLRRQRPLRPRHGGGRGRRGRRRGARGCQRPGRRRRRR